MPRDHCPPNKRGHTWGEVPGHPELRVCRLCKAPGRVDKQGRVISLTDKEKSVMQSHPAITSRPILLAAGTLDAAGRAWALADRACDDRAAELQGIERAIASSERPVPRALLNDRDAAVIALREACKREGALEEDLRAAARALLDEEGRTS